MVGNHIKNIRNRSLRSPRGNGLFRRWWLMPSILGAVAGLIFLLLVLMLRSPRDTVVLEIVPESDANVIEVWVGGSVAEPGLYQLERGSRVADAISAAGGAHPDADTTGIGMAARLEDADQIIVPPSVSAENLADEEQPSSQNGASVNLNTANQEQLESLPHIGPVIASRIIEYRQRNGPFQDIGELVNVSGISDRIIDDLGDQITVGR